MCVRVGREKKKEGENVQVPGGDSVYVGGV